MKLLSGCALFGAARALGGIRDAVVLQHSVAGCQWGTLSLRYLSAPYGVSQSSSVIYEPDVTFGGIEQLKRMLDEAEKQFAEKKAFWVISGCVPNMIGDDVEAVLKKRYGGNVFVHVKAPGYAGDAEGGAEEAYLSFLSLLSENTVSKQGNGIKSINIFGLMSDDPYVKNDLQALKQLLGEKVRVNCCSADCSVAELQSLPMADLNVVFGYGVKLCQELATRYGQPWVEATYPYGITGAKAFLLLLSRSLQLDFSAEIVALESVAASLAYRATDYLANLYGLPVVVAADKSHLTGMVNYLCEELGMSVVLQADTVNTDIARLEEIIKEKLPSMLCGSSFLLSLAERYQLPLLRIVYPITDRVSLSDVTFCGGRGSAFLLETIVNAALQQKYKGNGLYADLQGKYGNV